MSTRKSTIARCFKPWRTRDASTPIGSTSEVPSKAKASKVWRLRDKRSIENFSFLEIHHAGTLTCEIEPNYASLAQAAGVATPGRTSLAFENLSDSQHDGPPRTCCLSEAPPPLPEKLAKIDMDLAGLRKSSAPPSMRSQTSTPTFALHARYTSPVRTASPSTPSGSSFAHNRSGSSISRPPPPPLLMTSPPRKGSLPGIRTASKLAESASVAHAQRNRSASLDLSAAAPFLPPRQSEHFEHSSTTGAVEICPNNVPETAQTTHDVLQPPEVLFELDAQLPSMNHLSELTPSRSPDTFPQSASHSQFLGIQTTASSHSLARASSQLSVSQSPFPRSPHTDDTHGMNTPNGVSDEGHFISNAGSSSSCYASVPHDALLSPVYSFPSKNGHRNIISGDSSKSFDLSAVSFELCDAPPLPDRGRYTKPRFHQTAAAKCHVVRSAVRTPSVRSTHAAPGRLSRRPSKKSERTAEGPETPHSPRRMHVKHGRAGPRALAESTSATVSRPLRWKAVKVSEAKKKLTSLELQQIVLRSMREYAADQNQRLILEGFEDMQSELEQCNQRLEELEVLTRSRTEQREAVLKRHLACLNDSSGDQGRHIGESLVTAIWQSARHAQEACQLLEHVNKIEKLRDAHWRATASISLAKLNSSYLKAKSQLQDQAKEMNTLRQERDEAVKARDETMEQSKHIRDFRSSTLTVPLSVLAMSASQEGSPSAGEFDLSNFPLPPHKSADRWSDKSKAADDASDLSRSDHQCASQASCWPPRLSSEVTHGSSDDTLPVCSLPTPPISRESSLSQLQSSVENPAISRARSKRLGTFRRRIFTHVPGSRAPALDLARSAESDSDLPWARITSPSPFNVRRVCRSNSLPPSATSSTFGQVEEVLASGTETLT